MPTQLAHTPLLNKEGLGVVEGESVITLPAAVLLYGIVLDKDVHILPHT